MDLKNSIFNFLEQEGNSNDFEKLEDDSYDIQIICNDII